MEEEKKLKSIDGMKEKIGRFGDKAIWQSIEKVGDYQVRLAYRKLFFLAEGSLDK